MSTESTGPIIPGLRPDNEILGFHLPKDSEEIWILQVKPEHYALAVEALGSISVSYSPALPWTEEEWNRIETARDKAQSFRAPTQISHLSLIEKDIVLRDFGTIVTSNLARETFLRDIQLIVPEYFHSLGVALIDLCSFSAFPMYKQLELLRQMDRLLSSAARTVRLEIDPDHLLPPLSFASTGDGYYFFSTVPSWKSNRLTFQVFMRFMVLAKQSGLEVKSAYTVDEAFIFNRTSLDRIEGTPSTGPLLNLGGTASNSLSRVINKTQPNQILLTHSAASYYRFGIKAELEGGNVELQKRHYRRPSVTDRISSNINISYITPLCQILEEGGVVHVDRIGNEIDGLFSPPRPFLVEGKHPQELFYVWNLCFPLRIDGAVTQVGLIGDDTDVIASARFIQNDLLDLI